MAKQVYMFYGTNFETYNTTAELLVECILGSDPDAPIVNAKNSLDLFVNALDATDQEVAFIIVYPKSFSDLELMRIFESILEPLDVNFTKADM